MTRESENAQLTTGLFRQEAQLARQDQLIGSALLLRGRKFTVYTILAFGVIVGLICLLLLGRYTRKERVSGYLVPDTGLIKLYTSQAGYLSEVRVKLGEKVKKNDILFVISLERLQEGDAGAEAKTIESLQKRKTLLEIEGEDSHTIVSIERNELNDRLQNSERMLGELRRQRDVQLRRVDGLSENVKRFERLVADQFVSEIQLFQQRDLLLEQSTKLNEVQRNLVEVERDINSLQQLIASGKFRIRKEQSLAHRAVDEVEQQIRDVNSRRFLVIKAPFDGTMSAVSAKVGQFAQVSTAIGTMIANDAKLEAELLVPSRAAGFISYGQRVSVRYRAYPFERFGIYSGKVTGIDRSVISSGEVSLPLSISEPVYRISVSLENQAVSIYGSAIPLQSGMLLDADIATDTRTIAQWLTDPIVSFTKRQ